MLTYIVASQTNYDLMVHIVNAETPEEAVKLAMAKGAWPHCEAHQIDTAKPGVIMDIASDCVPTYY